MGDSLLSTLLEIVTEHYAASEEPEPLLLSELGSLLSDSNPPVSLHPYNTLKKALEAVGEDKLQIVRSEEVPSYVAVVTPEKRAAVEAKIKYKPSAAEASDFDALPSAVKIAFCVLSDGAPVYLRILRPFRYQRGEPSTRKDEYRLIEDRFRMPGLKLGQATATQKDELWHRFNEWLRHNRLPLHDFLGVTANMSALERLLSAQHDDVLERMLIPGDIARLLSRHE